MNFLFCCATQGLRGRPHVGRACRTVPSAGCRHAFETYLALFHVQGLEQGIYRYLPLSHQRFWSIRLTTCNKRSSKRPWVRYFVGKSAVTFIWTAIPYRMEWRYGAACTRSSPSMLDMSARTSTWPVKPSAPAPAPLPPTIRREPINFYASMATGNLSSTWPPWAKKADTRQCIDPTSSSSFYPFGAQGSACRSHRWYCHAMAQLFPRPFGLKTIGQRNNQANVPRGTCTDSITLE